MVPMTTDDIKLLSKNILSEIHDFCNRKGIRYFMNYGTLLGAVRHKGFIPWDDDVDISMPRPDYERFLTEFKSDSLYLFGAEVSKEKYYSIPFVKVCSDSTIATDLSGTKMPYGVGVDVFPIDGLPSDNKKAIKFFKKVDRYYHYGYIVSILCEAHVKHGGKLRNLIIAILRHTWFKLFTSYHYCKNIIKMAKKYPFDNSNFCGCLTGISTRVFECHPIESYKTGKLITFEDTKFYGPLNPEVILTMEYGENYMTPPPENKRQSTHETLYYRK